MAEAAGVVKVAAVMNPPTPVKEICPQPGATQGNLKRSISEGSNVSAVPTGTPKRASEGNNASSVPTGTPKRASEGNNASSVFTGTPKRASEGNSASSALASQLTDSPRDGGPVTQNGHGRQTVAQDVPVDDTPASASAASNACPPGAAEEPDLIESAGARFWKTAVQCFFDLYLEHKLQDIVGILVKLDVSHWRQLLEFKSNFWTFLKQPPHQATPSPPALPTELFAFLLSAYVAGEGAPPMAPITSEPLWYLEAVLLLRLLLRPSSSSKSEGDQSFPAPSRVVQFLVNLSSSPSTAAFLFTAGLHGSEAAWVRHGGDVFLAIQHIIACLFADDDGTRLWTGARSSLAKDEIPSLVVVLAATAFQFSAHLLVAGAAEKGSKQGDALSADLAQLPLNNTSQFASAMRCVLNLSQPEAASQRIGDRFLLCLRDVLQQNLGPAPSTPRDLPDALPPLDATEGSAADDNHEKTEGLVDIKSFARIVRTLLQAYSTDPTLLAAREVERQQQAGGADVAPHHAMAGLFVGSFAGPSEPGDFVFVPESGPLRRSLAFMEQSALLHVVQSKLLASRFADVTGSTEQLSFFALRNLRVLWFDLRRCTSTLKRGLNSRSTDGGTTPTAESRTTALLMLRNIRLCLEPDWEAKLATFPYFSLSGRSRVTVKSLVISVHLAISHKTGVVLQEVEVGLPDLDIQLTCSSTFSQMVLSIVLAILQAFLQEHIQKQLRKHLLQLLEQEISKWNQTVWKPMTWVIPESLISRALSWLSMRMPPEGLPI